MLWGRGERSSEAWQALTDVWNIECHFHPPFRGSLCQKTLTDSVIHSHHCARRTPRQVEGEFLSGHCKGRTHLKLSQGKCPARTKTQTAQTENNGAEPHHSQSHIEQKANISKVTDDIIQSWRRMCWRPGSLDAIAVRSNSPRL